MPDSAPGHVGDMQQPIDSAQVHKRAVLGDVLDGSVDDLAFRQIRERSLPALIAGFLEQQSAGDHDIASPVIDLDDLHREALADKLFGIANRMKINLRAGEERLHADVHHHSALDAAEDTAFDHLLVLEVAFKFFPDLHFIRFFLGQNEVALAVLPFLDINRKPGPRGERAQFLRIEFFGRNDAFRFVTDVHDHLVLLHQNDRAFDHRAFLKILKGLFVQRGHFGFLGRSQLHLLKCFHIPFLTPPAPPPEKTGLKG